MHQIDSIDAKIIRALQQDGRLTNAELAERVGLSATPCLRRVRILEQSGIIARYAAVIDQEKVGLGVSAFVQLRIDRPNAESIDRIERELALCPEVVDCYLMTGRSDYLLRVVTPDIATYERFLRDRLNKVPGISNIETSFAMRQVVHMAALPVKPGKA